MKKIVSVLCIAVALTASELSPPSALTLDEAINILKSKNLEIKVASLDVESAKADIDTASGNHWGKLEFIQDFANSNDAGNVFGFKLSSREATFGDFGAKEFMTATGMNGGVPPESAYTTPPSNLNYPDSRNYFQSKLKYEVPLFTGFQITSYTDIMNSMTKMKTLEKHQVVSEKIYQLRKSFYDMALLKNSEKNLNTILGNINTLENMTTNMIEVGYAKKVDLLEVQAKKGNVQRLINEIKSNQALLYHYISFLVNQKVSDITTPTTDVSMASSTNEEILQSNLDIKKALMGLDIRKSMVDVSKSSYYPMIGAFAETSTADNTFLGDADMHKAYTVGARLSWNIFNGGIDNAKLEKSRIEHLKTTTQVQLAKEGIALQVAKIRTEIETSNSEIASLEKELLLANEIYSNYEGRYKEKLSSMSDVIIKQSEQIQKILQLQQAHNKRNERIFALENLANGEKNDNN
ncbi:MAG: TolC family protein [Sulfurimonas sp.]|jgi:outer membrane protein TolC